jgi:hypothetical protein
MNNIQYPKNNTLLFTSINKNDLKKKNRSNFYNEYNKNILSNVKNINNEPFIFKAKESPIKLLRIMDNDAGKMKHFTPAAQEWYNSIYAYNKNYIKLLPAADKNLMSLLKSYFNLFLDPNFFNTANTYNRSRKLSANKIYVGKGDLKHSNEKVIVTSYVYNAEQLYLKSLVYNQTHFLYYPKKNLIKKFMLNKDRKMVGRYNRPFSLKEYISWDGHDSWYREISFSIFWNEYVKFIGKNQLKEIEKKKKKSNIIFEDLIRTMYLKTIFNKNNEATFKDIFYLKPFLNFFYDKEVSNLEKLAATVEKNNLKFEIKVLKNKILFDFNKYLALATDNYLDRYKRLSYLLMINKVKFEKPFMSELIRLVQNIYNKEIEFNIVNLNKIHLNSDIFTQAVSLKLKNRKNSLFRILALSLSKARLPNVNRMTERQNISNKDEYLINNIRNAYINSMFKDNSNVDGLNNLLLGFFPSINKLELEKKKRWTITKQPVSLYGYIFNRLKHFKLAGVRLEVKGRLTRRFTASKSVFRVRWKGGLRNVDSSFKKLPALMLRGDRPSNVEYSVISSKNRIGAFGIKGWVGSK